MHYLDKSILEAFKEVEGKELTTSQIVKYVFPDDADYFDSAKSDDVLFLGNKKEVIHSVRRKKSLLHKRLLYHLNKLVDENILKLSGIKEFGEKKFSLVQDFGDVIIQDKKETIFIRNNLNPVTPIDGYISKRIIKKFRWKYWISRLDSILLDSKRFLTFNKLHELILELFEEINDVIALESFEDLIQKNDIEATALFLSKIDNDLIDYDKRLSLLIDCDEIVDHGKIREFIKSFIQFSNNNIQIIFELSSETLLLNSDFFKFIFGKFSENKIKINIKNKLVSDSPFFYGDAGLYSFTEKEWKSYKKIYSDKVYGACCCASTLIVDIKKFFDNYSNAHEFRDFILKANKALLIANVNRRKIARHYFKTLDKINSPYPREFFFIERNYLRLWNYDFKLFDEKSFLLELLKTSKDKTDKFCLAEETIYNACGIPIRFKIAFSSAFRKSDKTMTQRSYTKRTVNDITYFENPENMAYLKIREKLLKLFDGGDRVRFFRSSVDNSKDIIDEFDYILQNFKIPFFTYDFSKIRGNTKLTSFFNNQNGNKRK